MAKAFLDTNIVIDIAYRKQEIRKELDSYEVCISPLSIHILCYTNKIKVPDKGLERFKNEYFIVDFTEKILEKSINGPTKDLEDNIQLHSASEIDSEYFLTFDKELLKMKFFGKTEITNNLNQERLNPR